MIQVRSDSNRKQWRVCNSRGSVRGAYFSQYFELELTGFTPGLDMVRGLVKRGVTLSFVT